MTRRSKHRSERASDLATILVLEYQSGMFKIPFSRADRKTKSITIGREASGAFRKRSESIAVLLDSKRGEDSGEELSTILRDGSPDTPVMVVRANVKSADRMSLRDLEDEGYAISIASFGRTPSGIYSAIRPSRQPVLQPTYRFGQCEIDFDKMTVLRSGSNVVLTSHSFKLLKFFTEHPGIVLTRKILLDRVWGYYPGPRTVDNLVVKLRRRLEPDPGRPRHLLTVHGVGYKFVP